MKEFDSYQADKNVYEFSNEPLFLQSEYYNLYFQKSIEELGDAIDLKSILVTSAHEIAYSQFSRLFKVENTPPDERKKIVEDYYANCGFGKINLSHIQNKGGHVEANSEHYAEAWKKHFGNRAADASGVGYFTLGFLCGVTEAIFDIKPGTFDGKQLKCISKGDKESKFEIFRGFKKKINASPAMGNIVETFGEEKKAASETIDALVGLNLSGVDHESGFIDQFETTLTKHYVNYFSLIEIKLLMQANKKLGPSGFKQVKNIIQKTSEQNAYFTFGKILNSDFWKDHLKNSSEASDDEDMKNCLDVMTGLGHGHWELDANESTEFTILGHNCPKTNSFLKLVGNTKAPIGFYNTGMLIGIANLMKKGASKKGGIDIAFVDEMAGDNQFEAVERQSRMTGAETDTLIVSQT